MPSRCSPRPKRSRPGARATLEAKALQLTGGPTSEKAPAGRNQYAWVMESGKADVFLTYCTNAVLARKEVASLQIVADPAASWPSAPTTGWSCSRTRRRRQTLLARFILARMGKRSW